MSGGKQRLKRSKLRRFQEQKGLCYHCQIPMTMNYPSGRGISTPLNAATLEHLDDKFSNERGEHQGEIRVVIACYECNHKRGNERQNQQPLEELQKRAKRFPKKEEENGTTSAAK